MMRHIAIAAALLCAATALPAAAQQTESDDKVVVQGKSAEDAVRDFVAEVGSAPEGMNLARWDGTVCVGVYNLAPKYAQALIDQVSIVGVAVGLEPGEPGCKPNILIMADHDGDALAARLVEDHLRKFLPAETHGTDLGRKGLEVFKTSDAPVRWWQLSQTVQNETGAPIPRGDSILVRGASRLRSNVRQEMAGAIIILDAARIGTISFPSLMDYVSMVALAQIDAEADTREFPTILNLFDAASGERTARMTQWDLDYLTGLYETPGNAASTGSDARHIARKMLDESRKQD